MTNDTELKPCPFCGGEARLDIHYNKNGRADEASAMCARCSISNFYAVFEGDFRGKAIKTWNTRHVEDKLKTENEQLKAKAEQLQTAVEALELYAYGEWNDEMDCIEAQQALKQIGEV